jgi:hypothetical protein
VYHSGILVPRDVGSAGVGLVHGLWFFWVVWFVRLRMYHSGIVVPRDVGSAGVGLGCVVRIQRPSDAPCGLKRGCGPEPRGGNPAARSRCTGFPFRQSLMIALDGGIGSTVSDLCTTAAWQHLVLGAGVLTAPVPEKGGAVGVVGREPCARGSGVRCSGGIVGRREIGQCR